MKWKWVAVVSLAAWAQASEFGVSFPDGARIMIEAKSTGPNVQTPHLGGVEGEGLVWHRVVSNKQGVLFAYDLEASLTASGSGVRLRIKPLGATFAEKLGAGKPVPTVAAVRDFPEVRYGESVMLDILYNPTTGDKIYDVLRPTQDPLLGAPGGDFILSGLNIRVNGQVVWTATGDGSISGDLAMIYLPGRGAYYFAVKRPPSGAYEQTGRVDWNRLTFTAGGDQIEVTGKGNLLRHLQSSPVWVRNNPNARMGESVVLGSSDIPSRP
jgi:hypothetical protein